MTWANFYLICFIVGFTLSLISFLAGAFNFSIPGLGDGDGGGADLHLDHGGFDHGGLEHGGVDHAGGHAETGHGVSPFNFSTAMAFLAWFGGAGYLLTAVWKVWAVMALGLALLAGLGGGAIVFAFLAKVLMRTDPNLHDSDYELTGMLGRVSNSIFAGGTGEVVYSQEGTVRECAARSEDGAPIPKGTEVVVTRYEKGIAYVRRWDDLAEEDTGVSQKNQTQG